MDLLELSGVHKAYGATPVLAGLDLRVTEGECVVLIGGSGSGKSTLLRCVNLLEVVDDGQIFLDGQDITDPRIKPDPVRARIGIVFQAFNLFPHLTATENLMLAPVRVHRVPAEQARRDALAMLDRVGLADRGDSRPDQLSGGQQQRVAIARALVNRPRLLLLDEVTSALDPELVGDVLDLLRDLRSEGMTMVLATHEMGFARRVADRICFLADVDGRGATIVEQGAPAELLDHPRHPRTAEFLRRLHG